MLQQVFGEAWRVMGEGFSKGFWFRTSSEAVSQEVSKGLATLTLRTVFGKELTVRSKNKDGVPYELPRFLQHKNPAPPAQVKSGEGRKGAEGQHTPQAMNMPYQAQGAYPMIPMMPPPMYPNMPPPGPMPFHSSRPNSDPMGGATGPERSSRCESPRAQPYPMNGRGEANSRPSVGRIPTTLPSASASASVQSLPGQ